MLVGRAQTYCKFVNLLFYIYYSTVFFSIVLFFCNLAQEFPSGLSSILSSVQHANNVTCGLSSEDGDGDGLLRWGGVCHSFAVPGGG